MIARPTPAPGTAVTLAELIAARAEAHRLGLGGARGLAVGGGGHLSRLRGPGVEYAESRPYSPGDDPRGMDWRVTARAARPHVKVYREERERPVWLIVDQGPAMRFGTRIAFKSVLAARAAALLVWGALAHGDRVGSLVLDGATRRWHHPQRREAGVLALLRALAMPAVATTPCAGFAATLDELFGVRSVPRGAADPAPTPATSWVRPGSLVFLISDFADLSGARGDWLPRLTDHSEVVTILVYDPIEAAAPPAGRWPVTDGEAHLLLDLTESSRRALFTARFTSRRDALLTLARRHGAHVLTLATDESPGAALARAFARPVRTP